MPAEGATLAQRISSHNPDIAHEQTHNIYYRST